MASSRKRQADRDRRLLRQHVRETGQLPKRAPTVADLIPADLHDEAAEFIRADMNRKRALTAQVQARESAERAERRRSDAEAAERDRQATEAAERQEAIEAATRSAAAAHARIDRMSDEQRAEAKRESAQGVNVTREGK